jgi:hypothetical protein
MESSEGGITFGAPSLPTTKSGSEEGSGHPSALALAAPVTGSDPIMDLEEQSGHGTISYIRVSPATSRKSRSPTASTKSASASTKSAKTTKSVKSDLAVKSRDNTPVERSSRTRSHTASGLRTATVSSTNGMSADEILNIRIAAQEAARSPVGKSDRKGRSPGPSGSKSPRLGDYSRRSPNGPLPINDVTNETKPAPVFGMATPTVSPRSFAPVESALQGKSSIQQAIERAKLASAQHQARDQSLKAERLESELAKESVKAAAKDDELGAAIHNANQGWYALESASAQVQYLLKESSDLKCNASEQHERIKELICEAAEHRVMIDAQARQNTKHVDQISIQYETTIRNLNSTKDHLRSKHEEERSTYLAVQDELRAVEQANSR